MNPAKDRVKLDSYHQGITQLGGWAFCQMVVIFFNTEGSSELTATSGQFLDLSPVTIGLAIAKPSNKPDLETWNV